MGKDPAVLFYTSDFLSGTSFFTMEQRGQYITLLCEQHQNGHIPENHMKIICSSYDSEVWKKFIKDENGNWYNVRMESEHQKRISYCESRGKNRKDGSLKKSYDTSYENHMSPHMENENRNRNKDEIKDVSLKREEKLSFKIPTIEEIKAYCLERKNNVDPEKFYNFYESKGWMIGKNKMKSWQAAIRTWEKNKYENNSDEKTIAQKRQSILSGRPGL